jgi:hypothetical protein
MAFLRFLLVINVNIPALAMLGDLLESSVFNFQVLNVTQEDNRMTTNFSTTLFFYKTVKTF